MQIPKAPRIPEIGETQTKLPVINYAPKSDLEAIFMGNHHQRSAMEMDMVTWPEDRA